MSWGTASARFGAPGPFLTWALLLAYLNDGARIWNGDHAEKAGSLGAFFQWHLAFSTAWPRIVPDAPEDAGWLRVGAEIFAAGPSKI